MINHCILSYHDYLLSYASIVQSLNLLLDNIMKI